MDDRELEEQLLGDGQFETKHGRSDVGLRNKRLRLIEKNVRHISNDEVLRISIQRYNSRRMLKKKAE